MYFIINISKPPREITISDLNFTLGPNKAIDLEKVRRRSEIEDSQDLKQAIKTKIIEVRNAGKSRENEVAVPTPQPVQVSGMQPEDLHRIREAIREDVKQELRNQVANGRGDLLPELLEAIKQLQQSVQQGAPFNQSSVNQPSRSTAISPKDDDIDEDKLAEIHARSIAKKIKPTEGNLNYQETRVKDSIRDRVKELDELIDG